jgi:hypothetical protein
METLPALSTSARTALAIWLAQSPPEPGTATTASLAICARLARSAVRKTVTRGAIDRDSAAD